jgi:hypothetical protein
MDELLRRATTNMAELDDKSAITWSTSTTNTICSSTKIPFSHNHLHDLESLWWVTVWIIINNYFLPPRPPSPDITTNFSGKLLVEDVNNQLLLAQTIFLSVPDSFNRFWTFASPTKFHDMCQDKSLRSKAKILEVLDHVRKALVEQYSAVESTLPMSMNPAASDGSIYMEFKLALKKARQDHLDVAMFFHPNPAHRVVQVVEQQIEATVGRVNRNRWAWCCY